MREPPSAEAWEGVRSVFASMLGQVETLTAELVAMKKGQNRRSLSFSSRAEDFVVRGVCPCAARARWSPRVGSECVCYLRCLSLAP